MSTVRTQGQAEVEPAPWLRRASRPGSEFARRVLESTQGPPPSVRMLNGPDATTAQRIEEAPAAPTEFQEAGAPNEPSRAQLSWQSYAGAQALAEILDQLDPAERTSILASMAGPDSPAAEPVRARPAKFGDLATTDPALLRLLTDKMDWKTIVVALKGALPVLAERFVNALPPADAALLRTELRSAGPARLRDVQDAQRQVLAELHALIGKER